MKGLFTLGFLLLIVLALFGCSPIMHEVKRSENLMGTVFTITIYDTNLTKAELAVNDSFAEIKRIENVLSIYRIDSEISMLNRNKIVYNPSSDLRANVEKSLHYSNLSDGAFDITVQPILDLYTESFTARKRAPTDAEVQEELKKVDYKQIMVTDNSISIGANQKITLGGIAKGYAVKRVVELLKESGIAHALVNAGGNMRAIGEKPGNLEWNVALENPRNKSEYITLIGLNDNAVSTSGDYERYFNENKTFHHIVNPQTGYSATELISVTVVSDNAFDADALSTSIFVLGKEKGIKLVDKIGIKALIITREKEIIRKGIE